MSKLESISRRASRAPACLSALLVLVIIASGCTRPLRADATNVAKVGSTVAKQMAEFWDFLQQDTMDTYELNAFRFAYENQQNSSSLTWDKDREIRDQVQESYRALGARARVARAMQEVYESYAHLAEYDATKELQGSIDALGQALNVALGLPWPKSAAQALFKDIVTEFNAIQQNRQLLRESGRLIPTLRKFKEIYDKEKGLYSDISNDRVLAYKEMAQLLVDNDAVISTALVNRVLSQYQLRWPDPQMPFTQPALKAGIRQIIEVRALALEKLSGDVGEGISRGLGRLIMLHEQLAVSKPLSLQEALANSASVQLLLDQLRAMRVPVDFITDLLKSLQRGTQP